MEKRRVVWDKDVLLDFQEALNFIREYSEQNADKVKKEILKKINDLSARPEMNPPDKYKIANTGKYRAFELHHYRIAYFVKDDEIIIARIRHTSQNPLMY